LERPNFPLGSVCGRLDRFPVEGGFEGGLRTDGIYKNDTLDLPLVSYITVVRNQADTIIRCIESVFQQEYPNIEYIIIDGASTDGTLDIIKTYADQVDYFISQPDSGTSEAINKGIALASGQLISLINSDDVLLPGATQIVINEYKKTKADMICGRVDRLNGSIVEATLNVPRFSIPKMTVKYNYIYVLALYTCRNVFDTVGGFNESYRIINDFVWTQLCIKHNFNIKYIDNKLTLFSYGGMASTNLKILCKEHFKFSQEEFPFLTKRQAEHYFFGFFEWGAHRVSFYPIFSKLNKLLYQENEFRLAVYRTALYICIHDCWKIINLFNIDTEATIELTSVFDYLIKTLNESLSQGSDYNVSMKKFEELANYKKIQNRYYQKYYPATVKGTALKLIISIFLFADRLIGKNLYILSWFAKRAISTYQLWK